MAENSKNKWVENATEWNLGDLFQGGPTDPILDKGILQAEKLCMDFSSQWKGFWTKSAKPLPEDFSKAVRQYELLLEQLDRPLIFAQLNHSASTLEPERGALLARAKEARTRALSHLLFFEMEWGKAEDQMAHTMMISSELQPYTNWLGKIRKRSPHFLTEPEEKIIEVKNLSGRTALNRLFDEMVGRLSVSVDISQAQVQPADKTGVPLQEALNHLYATDRTKRKMAAEGISQTLENNAPAFAFILNSLVLDHQEDCRLRGHTDPMEPRNLENEIDPKVVKALMQSVESAFGLVENHYRLKGKLLGIPDLQDHDRYAPMVQSARKVSWPDACDLVHSAYSGLSEQAGQVVNQFLQKNWVDASPRKGKRAGAFSMGTVSDAHPYILMSYHGSTRDVATLAHELGHGIHQYLSQGVGYLQASTPLTTAEMASVFGEMLLFEKLVQSATDDKERLALYMGKIEDAIATVFRQVVLTQFEMGVHEHRLKRGELSVDDLNQLWLSTNQKMFGKSVKLNDGYKWWWSYIGHFIHSPFYCYSYAFGELLVLSLFQEYSKNPTAFSKGYMRVLSLGGSKSPVELLAIMGMDIQQPDFWDQGLKLLDDMQKNAERLANKITF